MKLYFSSLIKMTFYHFKYVFILLHVCYISRVQLITPKLSLLINFYINLIIFRYFFSGSNMSHKTYKNVQAFFAKSCYFLEGYISCNYAQIFIKFFLFVYFTLFYKIFKKKFKKFQYLTLQNDFKVWLYFYLFQRP